MKIEFHNPPGLSPTYGWSHVVTQTGGKTIYISGQVAIDERGQLVGKGDLRAQAERAWECVGIALKAAGATCRDLVKTNLYVVNYKPDQLPILREVRAKYIGTDHPPASTLVGVTALAGADWLIEIEAVAVVEA
jgi:enamine deaminase RidA (YjgF/YER057c/UK114 family)